MHRVAHLRSGHRQGVRLRYAQDHHSQGTDGTCVPPCQPILARRRKYHNMRTNMMSKKENETGLPRPASQVLYWIPTNTTFGRTGNTGCAKF